MLPLPLLLLLLSYFGSSEPLLDVPSGHRRSPGSGEYEPRSALNKGNRLDGGPGYYPATREQQQRSLRCDMAYVDLGTNVGIQVRKLYEPHLYPRGKILPKFTEYLGNVTERRARVCSFGFEPNPRHAKRLQDLEAAYRALGWDVTIFTSSAAGAEDGTVYFKSDGDFANEEWGSTVASTQANDDDISVSQISLPRFFRDYLRWDDGDDGHVILMKVDIEGMDEEVLHALLVHGQLCRVAYAYVEHVTPEGIALINKMLRDGRCKTVIEFMDDERYHTSNFPLPTPPSPPASADARDL